MIRRAVDPELVANRLATGTKHLTRNVIILAAVMFRIRLPGDNVTTVGKRLHGRIGLSAVVWVLIWNSSPKGDPLAP